MIEKLDELDRGLFLVLNGFHNSFFDFIMLWASDRFIWIPFYAVLVFFLVKYFKWESMYVLVAITIVIILSDQITSGLLKPWVERFRPCHDLQLKEYIHAVGRCGGRFGFASSHAANTFALASFIWLVFKKVFRFSWLMFVWAFFVSYSRIYLGVHYPGDVIIGAMVGIICTIMVFYLLVWIRRKT